jgi:hypothetical protein
MTSAHRVAILRGLTRQVAYQFWVERGRPLGSPEVDWFQAEILVDRMRSIWSLEACDLTRFHNADQQENYVAPAEVQQSCIFGVAFFAGSGQSAVTG